MKPRRPKSASQSRNADPKPAKSPSKFNSKADQQAAKAFVASSKKEFNKSAEKPQAAHTASKARTIKTDAPRSKVPTNQDPIDLSQGDFQRVYGKHPVREVLTGSHACYKVWAAQGLNEHVIKEFQQLARDKDVPFQLVPHSRLEHLLSHLGDVNHQGLAAEIGLYAYADWDPWIAELKQAQSEQNKPPFVLILDQIQDPHNLGAILRTAEAAGVQGVILPKHGSVGLSETVAKASAGAIETVPVLQVTNLNRTIEDLQALGLWVMGLSANGGQSHFQSNLTGPIALVIGSEHKGLRPNTEKHCDVLLHIPMQSDRSLNASVAAALAMYEVVRQRLSN